MAEYLRVKFDCPYDGLKKGDICEYIKFVKGGTNWLGYDEKDKYRVKNLRTGEIVEVNICVFEEVI